MTWSHGEGSRSKLRVCDPNHNNKFRRVELFWKLLTLKMYGIWNQDAHPHTHLNSLNYTIYKFAFFFPMFSMDMATIKTYMGFLLHYN